MAERFCIMIRFSCPQCKLVLQATEQKVGSITACPKCAKRMKVPEGPAKAKIEDPNRTTQHGFSVEQAVAGGDWFYVKDKKKVGPVAMDDIKQLVAAGQLMPSDVIIKTGMQKWLPIHGVMDLMPAKPPAPVPAPAPSPAAADGPREWFYVHNKQKSGPVSMKELKQLAGDGKLVPTDMILKEGTQKWLTVSAMSELLSAVASPARPAPAPTPPPSSAPTPAPVPRKEPAATEPSKDWFCVRNKQKSGPIPLAELRSMVGDGRLAPSDMVLRPGTQKWVSAEEIEELFGPAPVPPELAKDAVDKGPAVPEKKPALAPVPTSPSSPAVPRPAVQTTPPSAPAVPRPPVVPTPPSAPAVSRPAVAPTPPSSPAVPRPAAPPPIPAFVPPSAQGVQRVVPTSPSAPAVPKAKQAMPIPAITPPPPPPIPPMPDDVPEEEDEYLEETPLPTSAVTPNDEAEEEEDVDVERVASTPAPKGKSKKKGKGKGKRPPAKGPSRLLRMLIAGWLGVVVFRTVALIQYDPQLSLWLWPIEWVAGLAIAWLSFRRHIRLGIVVGLLGPILVLLSMGAFTAMGMGKTEGLEYLRYVMVPYGVIALVLGALIMQSRRKKKPKHGKGGKGGRKSKKREQPTTMRMANPKGRRMTEEEADSETEIGALHRTDD